MFEPGKDAHERGFARAVDADQTDALTCTNIEVDVFENAITPDTTELYATANLSGLKPGSKVTGAIHAVDVVTAKGEHIKDTSVASTDVDVSDDVDKAGGKLTTNFKFTGPDAGWPVGTYAVKVAVDGHEVGTQELTVAKAEPADSK